MKENNTYFGFARADITPLYNVQTVGFNREDNLSRGVLHRLFAQVSVWHSDEGKVCLVAIDHIGFMYEDSSTLRGMIGNRLGITREKVMLCFSHTHSSPNISLEPEYFRFLCEQVLSGVDEAEKNVIPVKAAWGTTEADIGVNRRNNDGVLDRRINILKVADAVTGELRLLVLRLTAHANVLYEGNYLISSDFIGVARELLEKKYGCSVMITQGASGNVKPRYEFTLEALDKMASAIDNAVAACIDVIKPGGIKRLSMFSQTDTFHADVPSMERAREISEEAMRINHIDGANWLKEVARLNAEGVRQQGTQTEIQYFVLNDGCLCGVSSEVMCELAVDIAKACKDELIYFGGYTNGCSGYLPTAEEYDKGGYEVLHSYLIYYIYHGRVMPFNRDTAEKLVKSVISSWESIRRLPRDR
jgi:hypothetical protein